MYASNLRRKMPETGALKGYWPLYALKINMPWKKKFAGRHRKFHCTELHTHILCTPLALFYTTYIVYSCVWQVHRVLVYVRNSNINIIIYRLYIVLNNLLQRRFYWSCKLRYVYDVLYSTKCFLTNLWNKYFSFVFAGKQ